MSATTQEVLPILLRSTTPVVSEKVLVWAQKMQEEEPLPPEKDADQSEPDTDNSNSNPPRQHNSNNSEAFERMSHHSFHASTPNMESSPNDTKVLEDLANSKSGVDYAGVADADEFGSNLQERSQTHSRRSSVNNRSVIHNNNEQSPALKHHSHDTSFGNLDAAGFDTNNKLNGDGASIRSARSPLKAPGIDVRSPTPSDPELKASRHSRAPSRLSNVQVASVHESDEDSETTRDENDARTVPVETVRVPSRAGSHKTRSVASHAPPVSERGRAMSPTGSTAKPKSRASALSPPPQSHGVKSPGSVHPSQMPLPGSVAPTPTHKSTGLHPLSNFGGSQRGGSNYAPSAHAPSQHALSVHAPSQHALSVHAPSERAPSEHAPSNHTPSNHAPSLRGPSQHGGSQYGQSHPYAPSGASSRASAKQPSQAGSLHPSQHPSQHGGSAMGNGSQPERRETSLHPLSNYPGVAGSHHQYNNANGSKYGGSQHSQHTPSLHPLTQHLAAQSNRSYSRASQQNMPYIPPHSAEDMLHAGVRGRIMAVSPTPSNPHGLPQPPPFPYPPHHHHHPHSHHHHPHHYMPEYMEETPSQMQMRPRSPDGLNEDEQHMVDELLLVRTPRTSYTVTPSALAAEVHNSSFHDEDLCILLHAADDDSIHDVVKKAVRKAIRGRVRKLGAKHEAALRRYHSPDGSQRDMRLLPQQQSTPQISERGGDRDEPPSWARDILGLVQETQSRLDNLERGGKKTRSYAPTDSQFDDNTIRNSRSRRGGLGGSVTNDVENASPITVTLPMHTPGRTGTVIEESVLVPGETEFTPIESVHGHTIASEHHHDGSHHHVDDDDDEPGEGDEGEDGEGAGGDEGEDFDANGQLQRDDSPGKQVLEDAIFHLHSKTPRTDCTHQSWEVQEATDTEVRLAFPPVAESEMIADIPDTEEIVSEIPRFEVERKVSPGAPVALESRENVVQAYHHAGGEWVVAEPPPTPPPWQRIHQRLLGWAIVWPMAELDHALNSTTRGHQVDEIALSIWCTQTYKRYVRARLTEHPPMRVDRLFIPPNVADAINAAVYNGRHGDACGMLKDMWTPFGLDGMPRILLVLCKHRKEENHWVVHRFSLPDGSLTTYDTYPERSLPDGRPLGWWFAIRIAWPNAMYPSPEHLAQRMVRIHRPMQLGIDNSVATAGIWRNLLMGSKAERSIDLERLRDLINTEVKNLRTRKETGKLSVGAPRQHWEEIA